MKPLGFLAGAIAGLVLVLLVNAVLRSDGYVLKPVSELAIVGVAAIVGGIYAERLWRRPR